MGLFSVLPEQLSTVETWVTRIFLLLGLLTIGPWALLLVYDFLFYLWRTATYEVPVIGGRARGRPTPKPPTLTERPSGRPRGFSVRKPGANAVLDSKDKDGGRDRDNNSNNKTNHDNDTNNEGGKEEARPRMDSYHDISEKAR